jgi:hypothetical protein
MMDPAMELTPAYRGWLWANAMSFLECANHSRNQPAARAAALTSLRGVHFGMREAEQPIRDGWRWHVPLAGAKFKTPFDLAAASAESLCP